MIAKEAATHLVSQQTSTLPDDDPARVGDALVGEEGDATEGEAGDNCFGEILCAPRERL